MKTEKKLRFSLLLLRLGIFTVMLMWTLDKFIEPEHSVGIFKKFYFLSGFNNQIIYAIGAIEMIIILCFLFGFLKRWTYGTVLILHAVSTFSAFRQYLDPWSHLLFFAAWPMLSASVTLYLFRDEDVLLTVGQKINKALVTD